MGEGKLTMLYKPFEVMLAEKSAPHSRPDWLYELKLDGQRCVAHVQDGKVYLQARSLTDITPMYPEVQIPVTHQNMLLDGELVCEDARGLASINLIQTRMKQYHPFRAQLMSRLYPTKFYAFDVMSVDGTSVMHQPLTERKSILASVIQETATCKVLPWSMGNGEALFESAVSAGHEGVMAKQANSRYIQDRCDTWQKMKPWKKGEFLAVGITQSDNREFGALILAEFIGPNKLAYVSTVASGLSQKNIDSWMAKPALPHTLVQVPDHKVLRFFRPEPIEVWYFERTKTGHLRFPRLRE